jgi:hypothetical protein
MDSKVDMTEHGHRQTIMGDDESEIDGQKMLFSLNPSSPAKPRFAIFWKYFAPFSA